MNKHEQKKRVFELIVLIAGGILLAAMFVFGSNAAVADADPQVTELLVEAETQDYSRFQHNNPMHARMPCLLCHKRDDNSAAPKLSGHVPCSGCHTQQFADIGSQICTICHTDVQAGATKRFPGLHSFNARFDHGRHLRQTNCATCHKPSRRGVALSVPSGAGAHSICYQCHKPQTEIGGKNIGSCGTCHQPGRPQRNSDMAAAFAKNFSHAKHSGVARLNCSSCHSVRPGSARGRQVSAPAASMHFASSATQSCASCHNNKRAFGGNDFKDCKRCHHETTFKF
jgi:c(7)-type cytochrome triheme protein